MALATVDSPFAFTCNLSCDMSQSSQTSELHIDNHLGEGRVPLVVAFTPNYFVAAATCLYSILASSRATDKYHITCLLTEPLSEEYRKRLRLLDGGTGRMTFDFMTLNEGMLEGVYIDPKYTIAASFRLLLPKLMPQSPKVIYLDCDIIVRQNLAQLYWDTELGSRYLLAAIAEAPSAYQEMNIRRVGCEPGQYINSGFLVMNLEQMRRENTVEAFLSALRVDYLEFPDQDVLNQVCQDRILYLPPRYNGIRTFMLEEFKSDFLRYYNEDQWAEVASQGTIHYTGEKPWRAYAVNFEIWWAMWEQLPSAVKLGLPYDRRIHRLSKLFRLPGVKPLFNLLKRIKNKR